MKIETRHDGVDWDGLINEVTTKVLYLQLAWRASERDLPPAAHAKLVKDIYMPAIQLLAAFCVAVEVSEEEPD